MNPPGDSLGVAAQVLCHVKASRTGYIREKTGLDIVGRSDGADEPNGAASRSASVARPARILSQAVTELAAMPAVTAVVSICARRCQHGRAAGK